MLQQLQYAHNKTAKNHRDKVRNLVAALFDESFDDPMLDAIKWTCLELRMVVELFLAIIQPSKKCGHFLLPFTAVCTRVTRRARSPPART